MGQRASAQCAILPLRRRWGGPLQEPGAGAVGVAADRRAFSPVRAGTTSGEDTDRLLQGRQSTGGLSDDGVHFPGLYVSTAKGGGSIWPGLREFCAGGQS